MNLFKTLLASLLLALATADLSAAPQFAASRTWLAANPPERWQTEWDQTARSVLMK